MRRTQHGNALSIQIPLKCFWGARWWPTAIPHPSLHLTSSALTLHTESRSQQDRLGQDPSATSIQYRPQVGTGRPASRPTMQLHSAHSMHTLAIRTDPVEPRRVASYRHQHGGKMILTKTSVTNTQQHGPRARGEPQSSSDPLTQRTSSEANGRTKTSSEFPDLLHDSTLHV